MLDPARPKVPAVMPLVNALYRRNSVGCCLHIALDDGNVKDSHIDFCIEYAKKAGHADCLELGLVMRKMSKTQRLKLSSDHEY